MSDVSADDTLVAEFNNGSAKAFTELYNRYYPRLFLFVMRMVRDTVPAREIIQETFLRLSGKKGFNKIEDLERYLYVAARNNSFYYIRSQKAQRKIEKHFTGEAEEEYADNTLVNDYLDADLTAALHNRIDKLPERQREIVILYYMGELKYKEIAARMNISERTVEAQLRNSLQKLRKAMLDKKIVFLLFFL